MNEEKGGSQVQMPGWVPGVVRLAYTFIIIRMRNMNTILRQGSGSNLNWTGCGDAFKGNIHSSGMF